MYAAWEVWFRCVAEQVERRVATFKKSAQPMENIKEVAQEGARWLNKATKDKPWRGGMHIIRELRKDACDQARGMERTATSGTGNKRAA